MPILSIMQLLMQVLAAAPGALSSVEEAMTAFHSSTGGDVAKVKAVSEAAASIAAAATSVALSATAANSGQPTPPTPPAAA